MIFICDWLWNQVQQITLLILLVLVVTVKASISPKMQSLQGQSSPVQCTPSLTQTSSSPFSTRHWPTDSHAVRCLYPIIDPAKQINASVTTHNIRNKGTGSRLITWFYDHLLSESVRNVKNVKASWQRLKYLLYVWNKFGFEKNRGNRNFGFDPMASVRFGSGSYEPFPNRNSVSAHP